MFNFTKKYRKASVDTHEKAAGISEKYDAAIKKIEWLESELSQKNHELDQSCKAQQAMSEDMKNCVASLRTIQNQLQAVAAHLSRSNNHIFELMKKNKALKSSGDEWIRRSIKLEFDVLTAKAGLKKAENERNSALQMCERLQAELTLADKENSRDRHPL